MIVGNVVDELGERLPLVPDPGQGLLELADDDPLLVLGHLIEIRAEGPEDGKQGEVGRRRDDDGVAFVEEEPADEPQSVLRPVDHQDVVGTDIVRPVLAHVPGDPLPHFREPERRPVLQGFRTVLVQRRLRRLRQVGEHRRASVARPERNEVGRLGGGDGRDQSRRAARQGDPRIRNIGLHGFTSHITRSLGLFPDIIARLSCFYLHAGAGSPAGVFGRSRRPSAAAGSLSERASCAPSGAARK